MPMAVMAGKSVFSFFTLHPVLKFTNVKNVSIVLNVVLTVAVVILYYLHFSEAGSVENTDAKVSNVHMDYSVAYINSDTVLANYDYFKEVQERLKEKSEKLETEYQNRAQGLQNEVNDYQRTLASLTIGQAKAIEESLVKKQQNLRLYQESLTQELLKEESAINQELYEKVTSFLQAYSKDKGLQLVVKYNQGSDVLFASDSMDITRSVIEGLNETYRNEQSQSVPGKSDTTAVE